MLSTFFNDKLCASFPIPNKLSLNSLPLKVKEKKTLSLGKSNCIKLRILFSLFKVQQVHFTTTTTKLPHILPSASLGHINVFPCLTQAGLCIRIV